MFSLTFCDTLKNDGVMKTREIFAFLPLISKLFTILLIEFFIIMHISSNIVQDGIFFRFLLGYQCFVLSMFL